MGDDHAPAPRAGHRGARGEHQTCRCEVFGDAEPLGDAIVRGRPPALQPTPRCAAADAPDDGGMHVHPAAAYALEHTASGWPDALDEIFIFTDGSAPAQGQASEDDDGRAGRGWAFVAVGRIGDAYYYMGCLYHGAAGSGIFIEQSGALDNNDMEFTAVIWALAWAIAVQPACPCVLEVDSLNAINVATARWDMSGQRPSADVVAAIQAVAEQTVELRYNHVRSHDGHPWNELADAIAKWAAKGHSCELPGHICDALEATLAIKWEWLRAADGSCGEAYPPIRGGAFEFGIEEGGPSVHHPGRIDTEGSGRAQGGGVIDFVAASFNARSMKEDTAASRRRGCPGRAAAMRRQVRERGILLMGVQEARTPEGARAVDGFLVISTGPCGQNLGCELWIDLEAVYARVGNAEFTVPPKDCVVVHSDPRLLLVRITAPRLRCTAVVAHAPHSGRPLEERRTWWKALARALQPHPDLLLMIDANGRLGTVVSEAVGPGGYAQDEDSNGSLFHHALQQLQLFAPATFCDFNRTDYTWISEPGALHRIDYVAVPRDWTAATPGESEPFLPDAAGNESDHIPVLVRLRAVQGRQTAPCRWRSCRVDKAKLADATRVQAFKDELAAISLDAWDTPVDEHERRLTAAVKDAAEAAFPREPGGRRRSYITDGAMEVIRVRRRARCWLRAIKDRARGLPAAHVPAHRVAQWAADLAPAQPDVGSDLRKLASRTAEGGDAVTAQALGEMVRSTARRLRDMLRADSTAFLESVAERVADGPTGAGTDRAWKGLRVLMAYGGSKRWARSAQALQRAKPDGTMATERAEIAEVVLNHFAGVEAAKVMPWTELADDHRRRRPTAGADVDRGIGNVCDLAALRLAFAKARSGKAPGIDGIADDFMRAAPDELARVYHPLLAKMALQCKEPVTYKGGLAVDLYKGSGRVADMGRYRSILLNATVCKHHHRFLRSRLLFFLQAAFLRSQCGGLPHRGTDMAAHMVRAFLEHSRHVGRTAAVAYVDLWSGFYTVVRQLVMPIATTADDMAEVVDSLQVPRCCEDALRAMIAEPAVVEKHGLDPHLAAMLTEAHCGTWFCVEGREEVARSRKGTRPGCSLADLVFNLAFAPALTDIQRGLQDADLVWKPPDVDRVFRKAGDADAALTDSTFADDAAFCAIPHGNITVADELARFCGIIADPLMQRGMRINWDKGKSGLMLALAGRHSRTARRVLFQDADPVLRFGDGGFAVHLEDLYRHLGGVVHRGGSMGPEIAARRSAMAGAAGPLRKVVFKRPSLTVRARLIFANSLALSRLLFNAQIWGRLSRAQARGLHADWVNVLRGVTGQRCDDPTRDRVPEAAVFAKLAVPDIEIRLRIARLRYLPRLLGHGPPQLLCVLDSLLAAGAGWPAMLCEDLEWMRPHLDEGASPEHGELVKRCVEEARHSPRAWLAKVRAVERRATECFADDCRRQCWRRELDAVCSEAGLPKAPGDAPEAHPAPRFICYECGATLASKPAWTRHRRMAHGVKHHSRFYAVGSVCHACCKDFRTRARLLWHFRHMKPGCLAAHAAFFQPIGCDEADDLDAYDKAQAAKERARGLHARNALLPVLPLRGPRIPSAEAQQEQCAPPEAAAHDDAQSDARKHRLAQVSFGMRQPYFVLHLFSGQRRPGDLQHQLEKLIALAPFPVWVLSLDVAVDRELCDLADPDFVAMWVRMARGGAIFAVVGGPPCETWSVARFRPEAPRDDKDGPRALRSISRLWGLRDLTRRERSQLELGNALLRTQVLFLFLASAHGFSAVMEHPARPWWRLDAPSSWLLPELRHLEALPGAQKVYLDQCTAGAPWRKPTTLFTVNLPELAAQIAGLPGGGRCCPALGHVHVALDGRAEDGTYLTAPAKTYPPKMCEVIAVALHERAGRCLRQHAGVLPFECEPEERLQRLAIPVNWYEPASWAAFTHDCAA